MFGLLFSFFFFIFFTFPNALLPPSVYLSSAACVPAPFPSFLSFLMGWLSYHYGAYYRKHFGKKRYKRLMFLPGRAISRPPTYSRSRYRRKYRGTVLY